MTAKICDDEEIEHRAEAWYTENKDQFREIDWDMEIDRFHLNNEGLQESLGSFVKKFFSLLNYPNTLMIMFRHTLLTF